MKLLLIVFTLFCVTPTHAKSALLTTKDDMHSVMLSEKAVACSGNFLQTLIEADERDTPTISLDAIETEEDLKLFAHHLEWVAEIKNRHPHAPDDSLHNHAPIKFLWSTLTIAALANLFKHADFYGVPILLSALEKQLPQRILLSRDVVATQLAVNNNPAWLADMPYRARNEVLARIIMQRYPQLFFTVKAAVQELNNHTDFIWNVQFNRDGTKLVTASQDGTARIWRYTAKKIWEPLAVLNHKRPVYSAQFSPDDSLIVTASDDTHARIWQPQQKKTFLFCGTAKPRLKKWQCCAKLSRHANNVSSARFNHTGSHIVTTCDDFYARIWERNEHNEWEIVHFLDHPVPVDRAEFSKDGSKIITKSYPHLTHVWQRHENNRWEASALPTAHRALVLSAQFNPDGSKIVTATEDGTAEVWEQNERNEWLLGATLRGHQGSVKKASFNHDGSKIITASSDNSACIWEQSPASTAWHQLPRIISNYPGTGLFLSAQFSPDSSKIVITSMRNRDAGIARTYRLPVDVHTVTVYDVIDIPSHNNQAGLKLTLAQVLPALQQLEPLEPDDTLGTERILCPLLDAIKQNSARELPPLMPARDATTQ